MQSALIWSYAVDLRQYGDVFSYQLCICLHVVLFCCELTHTRLDGALTAHAAATQRRFAAVDARLRLQAAALARQRRALARLLGSRFRVDLLVDVLCLALAWRAGGTAVARAAAAVLARMAVVPLDLVTPRFFACSGASAGANGAGAGSINLAAPARGGMFSSGGSGSGGATVLLRRNAAPAVGGGDARLPALAAAARLLLVLGLALRLRAGARVLGAHHGVGGWRGYARALVTLCGVDLSGGTNARSNSSSGGGGRGGGYGGGSKGDDAGSGAARMLVGWLSWALAPPADSLAGDGSGDCGQEGPEALGDCVQERDEAARRLMFDDAGAQSGEAVRNALTATSAAEQGAVGVAGNLTHETSDNCDAISHLPANALTLVPCTGAHRDCHINDDSGGAVAGTVTAATVGASGPGQQQLPVADAETENEGEDGSIWSRLTSLAYTGASTAATATVFLVTGKLPASATNATVHEQRQQP